MITLKENFVENEIQDIGVKKKKLLLNQVIVMEAVTLKRYLIRHVLCVLNTIPCMLLCCGGISVYAKIAMKLKMI